MKRNCKKCGEYIPYWDVIEGKRRSLKNRTFCLKCSPFGQHNTRNLLKPFIIANGKEQPKASLDRSKTRRRKKQKAVEYLGGKCCICGYDRCFAALDFHHSDPSGKNSDPSKIICEWSWEKIINEISECILVCSNCHREIHYGLYKIEELQRFIRPVLELRCVFCKKIYNTKNDEQIYCSSSCSQLASRKVDRPNKEELFQLVWSMPTSNVAKSFGVSDKAIEKWCRAYKIEKPPRGYWKKQSSKVKT